MRLMKSRKNALALRQASSSSLQLGANQPASKPRESPPERGFAEAPAAGHGVEPRSLLDDVDLPQGAASD
ncbi:MAG: hypothetical protein EBX37_18195 [Alphaproteobacteria bacterium]|nr:hypothetical protein [Alphaproteobacteria bacterium]